MTARSTAAVSARLSAVVPARNEAANIARCAASLAAQPEISEIIVVNDQSTDGTAEVLSQFQPTIPQLRLIENREPPPPGWQGKNWAISRGMVEATGDWLLFTDADVTLFPGAIARALADAERAGAALVSYSPEQEILTWWERAVIPFVFTRLAVHFSYARVCNPQLPDAAANGQFLLIRRDVYDAVGGHAAVAGEVVEDVALAQRVKRAGYAIHFAPGDGIARTRMYQAFAAMWEGWRKNLFPLMGGTRVAVIREIALVLPWVPLAMLLLGGFHPLLPLVGLVLLAGRHAGYALELRRIRTPALHAVYYLPAILLYAALLVASARAYARGRIAWKGREFTVPK